MGLRRGYAFPAAQPITATAAGPSRVSKTAKANIRAPRIDGTDRATHSPTAVFPGMDWV